MDTRPINFRTLDLNLLKVFDVVMVERNVTRAAERLAMTQPAVSNALRRLREATREELFIPTSTGVVPTAHAQSLWPIVRESLQSLQHALAPQAFDPRGGEHPFTLAMADATAAVFAPGLAAELERQQAKVDLRVVGLYTRDPRLMIEQGDTDVAIGFFPDVHAALDADGDEALMRLDPLYGCEYRCVMRKDHPLSEPGALTLDAYCAARHVRVSFAGRQRGFVDRALADLGRDRQVTMTVTHFFTATAVVRQSDLLTVLPENFVRASGFLPDLAVCDLPFELPRIDVGLLWHRRHENDSAQRWLRETIAVAARAVNIRA